MAEKLRYLQVTVWPTFHELVVKFQDHGFAEQFGERLTHVGVARQLRQLADRIEEKCTAAGKPAAPEQT